MGPLRVVEAFVDHIARSQRRLIVTLTSGMGSLTDNTSGGSIAYRTSKAAVNMAMRSVAADLAARGITCVVVNPGWVRTDMGGAGAPLRVEDSVAAMRALLERLGPRDSGKFFNHDGREHAW
jgi:NAD(P)-dependent dehydrogenase (short-subunit alcohol dehydrogenase family)